LIPMRSPHADRIAWMKDVGALPKFERFPGG
jgi:hypothetical protein